jgi:hypothetical protein
MLSCFLLTIFGCAEATLDPTQELEQAGTETPAITPSTGEVPATELKPKSEADLSETTTTDETLPEQMTDPESTLNSHINSEPAEPILLGTLSRNCKITRGSGNFDQEGLAVGGTAVNFMLKDINGSEFRLSQLLSEKPVMMVFGSFT